MQNNRYPIVLIPAEEGGYVALIRELPGCMTQGETLEEAIAMIEDAKNQWIEVALEHGDNIPLPDIDSLLNLQKEKTMELFDQGFYTAKGWLKPDPALELNKEYMDGWWSGADEQMGQDPFPYSNISDRTQGE